MLNIGLLVGDQPGFEWCPVNSPSPVVISPFVLGRLCRKCLHHMEALVMISPHGSNSLASFQWKQPFSHHMVLKEFVSICCFRRIVLYRREAGHRLVKWALSSNVIASWSSLFLFHFSNLFCSWKCEVGKGYCFPAVKGCSADHTL